MKNKITRINNEVKNIWNFSSFVVEIAAPVLLISVALGQVGILKIAFAVVAAFLAVNTAGKIYSLVRK